jgi:hypothetical protein
MEVFHRVFSDVRETPLFLPVVGNHDLGAVDFETAAEIVRNLEYTTRRDDKLNYYVDYRNVRIIAVNAYGMHDNDLAPNFRLGCLNSKGIDWVDDAISSATHADHVFIAMHEPPFPRTRHVGGSFDECEEERNAFWDMVVSHRGKVKAVLVGHTHCYSRMRVKDPRSAGANDPDEYPDQEGGVYQVDCGACGAGIRNTVVNIEIAGEDVSFRVVDAHDGPLHGQYEVFGLVDEWQIVGGPPPGP